MPDKQEYKAVWVKPNLHAIIRKCAAYRDKNINEYITQLVEKDYKKFMKQTIIVLAFLAVPLTSF